MKSYIKPGVVILSLFTVCALSGVLFSKNNNQQYEQALNLAVQFYDANRCGKDVKRNNAFAWRSDCHLSDGKDVGYDLSGGFHDAGDHVKFGLTQGFSASVLGWSYLEYKSSFKGDADKKMRITLRRFAEYFLKCHPRGDLFFYQVGDGGTDHRYWGSPEDQTDDRPTTGKADNAHPASDILGQSAGALALYSINFTADDVSFGKRCLDAAQELYAMGKKNRGCGDGQGFYTSGSYHDDLAWGALWLYKATGDSRYLDDLYSLMHEQETKGKNPFISNATMSWDDMNLPVLLLLARMSDDPKYKKAVIRHLDYWVTSMKRTPDGLAYSSDWGVLRYAAAESMIALLFAQEHGGRSSVYRDFAYSQIDYILGKNKKHYSYLIGFGKQYPQNPHHRASISARYGKGFSEKDCILYGALVGGPNAEDYFEDSMDLYQMTEVAIDYNACLVGALAGHVMRE